jgi:hypothetical protein
MSRRESVRWRGWWLKLGTISSGASHFSWIAEGPQTEILAIHYVVYDIISYMPVTRSMNGQRA